MLILYKSMDLSRQGYKQIPIFLGPSVSGTFLGITNFHWLWYDLFGHLHSVLQEQWLQFARELSLQPLSASCYPKVGGRRN